MRGSSPRVWGQVAHHRFSVPNGRIIPTRVGTSCIIKPISWLSLDHPHACGDKVSSCHRICVTVGSSPRVWGQVQPIVVDKDNNRIIPTRVGTRPFRRQQNRNRKDHPHACGDKPKTPDEPLHPLGSSPRVWGQGFQIGRDFQKFRIIPTRVGTRDDYRIGMITE